ncbi:MAG: hypothetical protein IPH26_01380 [Sterolibacteriaceae bacterium]|uniref:Uncharacterized protein n=1 Tax=Candidatus Methylophosphatis roskildensis TaxID=2899263 RepID=A0A9D7HKI3_9PROT|nr:hypothetical protein [Candidatus Methylophosphatis roskildensis]MBK7234271.1 hypothetical protein [Sterolibacteriaceae bacterium]
MGRSRGSCHLERAVPRFALSVAVILRSVLCPARRFSNISGLTVTGPAGSKTQTQPSYVKAIAANDLVVDFGPGNGIWAYINSNVHDGLWTNMMSAPRTTLS